MREVEILVEKTDGTTHIEHASINRLDAAKKNLERDKQVKKYTVLCDR